jgi:hypothetical protein
MSSNDKTGATARGELHRIENSSVPQLATANLQTILQELWARISSEPAHGMNELQLSLGDAICERLAGLVDVHLNRFSRTRFFDLFGMFQQDLQNLRGDFTNAAATYPELMRNQEVEGLISTLNRPASPMAMVELTKKLRRDATTNLKSFDDPAKRELGMAQRDAATALEDQIDRALQSVGKPGMVDEWRKARRTIAKSYDAEAAFNPETGNFSMPVLARMAAKGKPFTGGMKDAADFARSFEGSARAVDKM